MIASLDNKRQERSILQWYRSEPEIKILNSEILSYKSKFRVTVLRLHSQIQGHIIVFDWLNRCIEWEV